ncbi:SMC-Scp complex subunit ScpB [Bacteriovorax sp. BSW11_IV]|uniref:SMC-Scp complex subunit ScpB n=1 Tax=Bacteriovorax sp. BSW11_IV TaxID=1353529 RepID=UPI0009DBF360|nr:SMC-Scp complex subunit ScpB [Bacteriovorax sp. BSW11_IV]
MEEIMEETNSTHTEQINESIEMMEETVVYPNEDELSFPEVEVVMAQVAEELADYDGESVASKDFSLELNFLDDKKQEDKIWQARTGLNFETLCGAIETIIFMSDKPISLAKIKSFIDEDLPLRVIHEALARLQEDYEQKFHGIRLAEVAEGYQFRTKATYAKYIQDIFKVTELVLSPTALEVLAIIAYKQPVSKVEVEKIRGVDSSHIIRGLIDKRLVKVAGRSEEVGKPVLYATTSEFLEVFNINDLSGLPPEYELQDMATQSVGKIADIKTLVHDGDKKRFSFDELSELDELTESIKNISAETDFIKSLRVEEKKRISEVGTVVKTAFDLLEEFVNSSQVAKINMEAVASELMTAGIDPQVISDLSAGPFNTPEVFDEDEDFQMIDLDTGETILFDDEFDIEVELEEDMEEEDLFEDDLSEYPTEDAEDLAMKAALIADGMGGIDSYIGDEESEEEDSDEIHVKEENTFNLFNDDEDAATSLARALDQAFAKLTGSTLDDDSDLEETHKNIAEKGNNLDSLTDDVIRKGNDLDLDLSFLKSSENSSEDSIDLD